MTSLQYPAKTLPGSFLGRLGKELWGSQNTVGESVRLMQLALALRCMYICIDHFVSLYIYIYTLCQRMQEMRWAAMCNALRGLAHCVAYIKAHRLGQRQGFRRPQHCVLVTDFGLWLIVPSCLCRLWSVAWPLCSITHVVDDNHRLVMVGECCDGPCAASLGGGVL